MSTRFSRRDGLLAVAAYVALVAALPAVPRWIPADTIGVSAAAADGYNTAAAFWTVLAWAALVVAMFAWRGRRAAGSGAAVPPAAPSEPHDEASGPRLARRMEIAAVFVLASLAYVPLVLAPYAPFSEDMYFLTALGRMECGQVPYRDFGFLYGPSMIYLLRGWSQVFGVSLASYYGFLALFEGVQFAVLMAVLQRLVPQRRARYAVFLLLLPFLFNNLFGLNYNGARWLVPALAVLLASRRPHDRAATAGCAVLLGFHLTYSHEYAIAALLAITGMHAVLAWHGERRASVRAVLVIGVVSVALWAAVTRLLLGESMTAYIAHAREIVRMMATGHAGFRFYWTANSLALFGLLTMACAIVGARLAPRGHGRPDAGERLLVAAVLFTLVSLKSGLTRADLWHLDPNFLPLLIAFLLPYSASTLMPDRTSRRVAQGLVAVASVTFLVGIAPMLSLHATSYARGLGDMLAGRPLPGAGETGEGLERERRRPDADLLALGAYLRSTNPGGRPVLFYGRAWALSARIGVCPAPYKLDDLMYSEFTHRESDYLKAHPDTRIVIRRDEFTRLYGGVAPHSRLVMTPMKRLGRWLSSVHYDSAETEARLQDETRERLTGRDVRDTYGVAASFGEYIVLARR